MGPPVTNYSEIQQDEVEVLRSIYMEDFIEEEAKTGAWNVGNYSTFPCIFSFALAFNHR